MDFRGVVLRAWRAVGALGLIGALSAATLVFVYAAVLPTGQSLSSGVLSARPASVFELRAGCFSENWPRERQLFLLARPILCRVSDFASSNLSPPRTRDAFGPDNPFAVLGARVVALAVLLHLRK